MLQETRYAWRMLRKTPVVSAVAVMTLALGIGATVAIFQFVDAGMIHAVPFRDADRLVHISMTKQAEFGEMEASYPNFIDWKAQNTSFESMSGYSQSSDLLWAGAGAPEIVQTATVSSDFFSTLGVAASIGRAFGGDETGKSESQPAVISYASWKGRFAGSADILGHPIRLGSKPYTVIGVLPDG